IGLHDGGDPLYPPPLVHPWNGESLPNAKPCRSTATARLLDRDSDQRVLDRDADAAWRAYGSDLAEVIRCDLVLKNFAMLYPAAFAPGPVFGLSGWYDDDPWGAGFERPSPKTVEALFAKRSVAEDASAALEQALFAWGLARDGANAVLTGKLSPSTNVV